VEVLYIWIALYLCLDLLGSHVYKRWRDVAYALKLIDCTLKAYPRMHNISLIVNTEVEVSSYRPKVSSFNLYGCSFFAKRLLSVQL